MKKLALVKKGTENMRSKNRYAILGLGRYGNVVATELIRNGAEVIAIDNDENLVNAASQNIPICKCADVTDPEVLEKLGIDNVDTVIIAMASNLEASVMATTICKEIGVKNIIVKCANEIHQKILMRVGADSTVLPEKESGLRLARNLLSSGFIDAIELSDEISMIELDILPEWEGKTLIELNIRKKFGINIIAVSKDGKININVDPNAPLDKSTKLIVIANVNKINKLTKAIGN